MISSWLYGLNHAALWQRKVRVWDRTVQAASLDRLVFIYLHRLGWMGADEERLLRKLIEPGMQIVDVGANIGLYSLRLAALTGPGGHVYSFEPEPSLFATLTENCTRNTAANITPLQYAAGSASGHAAFQRGTLNSGNNSLSAAAGSGSIEVKVVRVDEMVPLAAVDFIKLDVQGHEVAALSGMERLLTSSPNVRVLFEFWPSGLRASKTEPAALLQFLLDRGFNLYTTEGAQLQPLADPRALLEKLGPRQFTNLLAARTGVSLP